MKKLTGSIFWIPPSEDPLSADVVIADAKDRYYVFDVGADESTADILGALDKPICVILSHFHPDHVANLQQLAPQAVYQGRFTLQKTHTGAAIAEPVVLQEDPSIRVLPFPSSHAKDSLALEVDRTYLFVGDGIYSTMKQGRPAYNAGTLQQTIRTLRDSPARLVGVSHADPFLVPKNAVLKDLEAIYALRVPKMPYIFVSE
ncbi:MAG: MBL fold metallo-hydrolase [Clostridia bacterium]|nr:MBL fold metallo-hydrolase [Clostridia bacterium]